MPGMIGFHALEDLPEEKITDTILRRVLTGEQGMIVWWSMKAGVHAAAHHHPHRADVRHAAREDGVPSRE